MSTTVSDGQLQEYFHTFHRVYREKCAAAIPNRHRGHLVRYGFLPSKLVAYVSTMWGVGYEYQPGSPGDLEILKGSARVEELLFSTPRGFAENNANIVARVRAPRFSMTCCEIRERLPCRLDSEDAPARLADLRLTLRGRVREIAFAELFGNRSPEFWSRERAIERAMDEVLEAAIGVREMERASIPIDEYLQRFKRRHVLVLGDYSESGRHRLTAIRQALARRDYLPLILDEITEFPEYDLRHKLVAVASVCRFVVVDDSSRAGHLVEIPEIEKLRVIAVVLRLRGSQSSFLTRPLEATSKIIKEEQYEPTTLDEVVGKTAKWAEERVKELGERFGEAYPWRTQG
jgi:hypothetical protein